MRVVLDTNVLVSACWTPGGLEAQVVQLALKGESAAFVSAATRMEYRKVLYRQKFAGKRVQVEQLLQALETRAQAVVPSSPVHAASDPDDDRFLECAEAAQADYLITGNLKHYPAMWGRTKIVNARQFLAECFPRLLPE